MPASLRSILTVAVVPVVVLLLAACGGDTSGSRGGSGGAADGDADAGIDIATGSGGAPGAGGDDGTGPVDVTVRIAPDERHQTLVGFGGAVAFYTNFLSDRTDDIFTVLFSDLGLDILRVANWYQNQTATGTSVSTGFSDTATVAIIRKATMALGHPPLILMSSWSPPAYLKSNGITKGSRGSLLRTGGVVQYEAFADWWVRSLDAYAANGVVPDYISVQNEPDFYNAGWETCQFDATEGATNAGYGRALDAVATAIAGSTLASKPQIIGPETVGISGTVVPRYLATMNSAAFSAVAHHLYSGGATGADPAPDSYATAMANAATAAAGKPIFMTEFSPAAPSLFNTAWMIHQALTVESVSACIYWGLIWAPPAAAGTSPSGLVTIAGAAPSSSYTINDTYWAVKHFARWTDPGWTRVGASASDAAIKATAFVSPDGASMTVVLLNSDADAHVVSVATGGFVGATATVYRTSGAAERAAALSFDTATVALPARAVASVVITP
jgi:glucuronoarabinoxylan endo-1,4-beta-xylanase